MVHEDDKIEESHACTWRGLKGSFGGQRNKSEGRIAVSEERHHGGSQTSAAMGFNLIWELANVE